MARGLRLHFGPIRGWARGGSRPCGRAAVPVFARVAAAPPATAPCTSRLPAVGAFPALALASARASALGSALASAVGRALVPARALVLGIVLTLCLGLAPAPAAFAQGITFDRLVIEGNARVGTASIASLSGLAPGRAVDAAVLNDAYQRLMASGLFEDVQIQPQGTALVVRVSEYPIVGQIAFEGNRRLVDEVLSQAVSLTPRRAYTPAAAAADVRALTEIYLASGRAAAGIEPRIIRRPNNVVDVVFEITEGDVIEVERIVFNGNQAFSDRRLRQVLLTKQAGPLRAVINADTFNPDRIEFDKRLLRDFYLSRGYVDVQVLDATAELTRARDAFVVTFSLREGRQFRIGSVDASSTVPEADAAAFLAVGRLRPGEVFSPVALEASISRMEALASRQGLSFVRVEPRIRRNDAEGLLDVTFVLTRGSRVFVERIDIEGNATTLDRVIRRQFRIVEGDPFDPRAIREAAERIRALGYFGNVDVGTRPGSAPDQAIVRARVEEQPTGSLTFGASYGQADGAAVTFGLSESNFLGRGQFLSFEGTVGGRNATLSLRFVEPALFERNLRGSLALGQRTTGSSFTGYEGEVIEARLGLEFPMGPNGRLETYYRASSSRITALSTGVSGVIVTDAARGRLLASGLGYGYSWDNRRAGLGEEVVRIFRLGQEVRGLGGDVRGLQTTGSAIAEGRVLAGELTLRATLEAGHLQPLDGDRTRVIDRFNLTGRLRGFEPFGVGPRDAGNPLGGLSFAVMRLDAEFPLGLPDEYGIRGGLFVDAGSLWGLDEANVAQAVSGYTGSKARLRSSIGASVLWTTPIGPLRFDFGYPIRKEAYDLERNFDLTIATSF
jgi:outer membrane protein insertion porin family